jgi:hypothetical protein
MGGAPYLFTVYKDRITCNQLPDSTITDQRVVEAANQFRQDDDGCNKLAREIFDSNTPFKPISELMSKGPAMDSINVVFAKFFMFGKKKK